MTSGGRKRHEGRVPLDMMMRNYCDISDLHPDNIVSGPYRREPYVRVELPDLGTVDAKARRWSVDRVLLLWETPDNVRYQAWVPVSWCQRISREESAWKDHDDLLS